ncbi:MAG: oxidoreductase [Pseudopedobacter saltans]|uniref:Oxidoreductase n=1 Tax=Pseudopedobacter saltans TaxID=151895 RepID=A0A2W5EZS9_9SPHI|nr:MAG: oxidoreductase [Pseudopedobacter saltans]
MEYRKLGKSDLEISRIGYGCMSLKNEEKENVRLLQTALNSGINYFDTADIYDKGANETVVGKAFKENRNKVILATKVGNVWKEDGSGLDWNPSKKHILDAVEGSLKRLQTDYIDLYQLHGGTIEDNIDETIEAFELLVQQGKIRYYGISSIRPNVIREYVAKSTFSSLMVQYSLLDRRSEETVLPLMEKNNIGVVVRGSLASGLLVDKPSKDYLGHSTDAITQIQKTIAEISSPGRDATAIALQYIWNNPAVTSAIVGIRTIAQLKDALVALESPALSENEIHKLKEAAPALTYTQHI